MSVLVGGLVGLVNPSKDEPVEFLTRVMLFSFEGLRQNRSAVPFDYAGSTVVKSRPKMHSHVFYFFP